MKRDNVRGLGFLYMSVWDVNNVLRMHASQLQSPLPYNDDYYYYHYRNFLTGIIFYLFEHCPCMNLMEERVELTTNRWREGLRCWIGFGQRGYI